MGSYIAQELYKAKTNIEPQLKSILDLTVQLKLVQKEAKTHAEALAQPCKECAKLSEKKHCVQRRHVNQVKPPLGGWKGSGITSVPPGEEMRPVKAG